MSDDPRLVTDPASYGQATFRRIARHRHGVPQGLIDPPDGYPAHYRRDEAPGLGRWTDESLASAGGSVATSTPVIYCLSTVPGIHHCLRRGLSALADRGMRQAAAAAFASCFARASRILASCVRLRCSSCNRCPPGISSGLFDNSVCRFRRIGRRVKIEPMNSKQPLGPERHASAAWGGCTRTPCLEALT